MALGARRPLTRSVGQRFDMRELWRVGLWGIAAAVAVTLAAFAATSSLGTQRIIMAYTQMRGLAAPPNQTARSPDRNEVRQLADTVRVLAADRDRLLARLSALERNVDDITGSTTRQADGASPPATAATPSVQPLPMSRPPADPPSTPNVAVNVPVPAPASPQTQPAAAPPESAPVRTEYGIDLGGSNTLEGLRTIWAAAKTRHAGALEGLRPIVTLRERPNGVELRLVAGPFGTAAAAARVCSSLGGAGALCQPAVFDGQRLVTR